MPYTITSKVLDENGYPIGHAVVISELSGSGSLATADVVADDNGSFVFVPLSSSSIILIEAVGYEPQMLPATQIPSEIRLQPAAGLTIEGKTTPNKKDNTWAYVAAAAAVLVVAVVAATAKKPTKAPTAAKGLNIPVIRFT